ncbi:MAG: tyrosine-type recombinase/integrase, partial [Succinivibrio sp.]
MRRAVCDDTPLEQHILANIDSRSRGSQTLTLIPVSTGEPFVFAELVELASSAAFTRASGNRDSFKALCRHIGPALGNATPRCLDDFDGSVLARLVEYDLGEGREADGFRYVATLLALQILRKQDPPNLSLADGLSMDYVERPRFASEWRNGFRAVYWDPMVPPPSWDKWILYPNGTAGRSMKSKEHLGKELDFTGFERPVADLMKELVWSKEASLGTRADYLRAARRLFGDGGRLLYKEIDGTPVPFVTASNVHRALGKCSCPGHVRYVEQIAVALIEHGKRCGGVCVDPAVVQMMDDRQSRPAPKEDEAIEEKNLRALMAEMEERSQDSRTDLLCYYALCLIAITPLRISEVFDLKIGELRSERAGSAYSLDRIAKGARGGKRKTLLTKTAKTIIDAVIAVTEHDRAKAPEDVGSYVFLYRGTKGAYRTLDDQNVSKRMKKAARKLEIEGPVTPKSVRKKYMTLVVEEGVKRSISRLGLRPYTNHARPETENKYYLRPDIRNYLEATNGIIIGEFPAKGELQLEDPACGDELLVEGGCGYCRNESCHIEGTTSCLMCKGFVTTPSHIPEFQEAVELLNRKIERARDDHDRFRLVNLKRLYLYYLGALMTLAREAGEG